MAPFDHEYRKRANLRQQGTPRSFHVKQVSLGITVPAGGRSTLKAAGTGPGDCGAAREIWLSSRFT